MTENSASLGVLPRAGPTRTNLQAAAGSQLHFRLVKVCPCVQVSDAIRLLSGECRLISLRGLHCLFLLHAGPAALQLVLARRRTIGLRAASFVYFVWTRRTRIVRRLRDPCRDEPNQTGGVRDKDRYCRAKDCIGGAS